MKYDNRKMIKMHVSHVGFYTQHNFFYYKSLHAIPVLSRMEIVIFLLINVILMQLNHALRYFGLTVSDAYTIVRKS